MSYLGFIGNENGFIARAMRAKNLYDVPWIAICISALPGTLAFMTASNNPITNVTYVRLPLQVRNLIQGLSLFDQLDKDTYSHCMGFVVHHISLFQECSRTSWATNCSRISVPIATLVGLLDTILVNIDRY